MSTWIEAALARAQRALERAGVRRWELCADEVSSSAVEVMDGAVEVIERSTERTLGIRVIDGGLGFSGLTEPDDADLEEAVASALREARSARPAAIAEFAAPADAAGATRERFEDPRAQGTARRILIDAALALEANTLAGDPRIARVRPARVDEERGWFALRTSTGLDVREGHTRASAMTGAVAEDGEEAQSSYAFTSAPAVELLGLGEIAREASGTAAALLGAGAFGTARVPVLFGFEAAADLIALLAGALDAERIERGASFLALGRALSPALVLADDPHDGTLDGACAHDGEGLATAPVVLVDGGVVAAVLDDRDSAARAGRAPNARAVRAGAGQRPTPGAHNLALRPGREALAALYARAEGGVYVQEVSGTHTMNEVTGELSLGATGWAVRGGARAEPITGITVAGTLPAMFSGAVTLSAETRRLGAISVPVILIEDVQVAGA